MHYSKFATISKSYSNRSYLNTTDGRKSIAREHVLRRGAIIPSNPTLGRGTEKQKMGEYPLV